MFVCGADLLTTPAAGRYTLPAHCSINTHICTSVHTLLCCRSTRTRSSSCSPPQPWPRRWARPSSHRCVTLDVVVCRCIHVCVRVGCIIPYILYRMCICTCICVPVSSTVTSKGTCMSLCPDRAAKCCTALKCVTPSSGRCHSASPTSSPNHEPMRTPRFAAHMQPKPPPTFCRPPLRARPSCRGPTWRRSCSTRAPVRASSARWSSWCRCVRVCVCV